MRKIIILLSLAFALSGCEWWLAQYDNGDGLPTIRSQEDVDAYNATVSSESEKLVCDRERIVGSNFPQWICFTVAQRDRMALEGREAVDTIRGLNAN
ncbi:MAG: hypothetical protein GKR91_12350 [Pseudomonadales bacterium]|nr:hypothetical protein [Pseudomonadales bacterium]